MNHSLKQFLEDSSSSSRLSREHKKELQEILTAAAGNRRALSGFREQSFDTAREKLPQEYHLTLNWLETLMKAAMGATVFEQHKGDQVWFSPGPDCLREINRALDRARKSVDICVFTITDDRIAEHIFAAQRRGIKVRIISDNDKAEDPGSDIDRFHRRGVAVHVDDTHHHMHHKFAIFDEEVVLTGSYNWTRSAAEYNEENIARLSQDSLVADFQKEFNRLWRQTTPYQG